MGPGPKLHIACTFACKQLWPALMTGLLMGYEVHIKHGIWDRKYGMHICMYTVVASPTDRDTDGTRDAP
jgi:hypothetical protein